MPPHVTALKALKNHRDSLAEKNRALYDQPSVTSAFANAAEVYPPEQAILRRYRDAYAGRDVLDLGVGGGRTAPLLAPHAASYVGIDYSTEMVKAARARFPAWEFRQDDARVLADFDPMSVDFVLFSLNGIDSVDHDDRMCILRRVAEVLRPGGVFAFSSHNLDMTGAPASLRLTRPIRPVRLAKDVARIGLSIPNYVRNTGKQVRTDEYAVLIDPAFFGRFLTYYIGADAQRRQLAAAGFTGPVEVFGADGLVILSDTASHFLHYVTRKP